MRSSPAASEPPGARFSSVTVCGSARASRSRGSRRFKDRFDARSGPASPGKTPAEKLFVMDKRFSIGRPAGHSRRRARRPARPTEQHGRARSHGRPRPVRVLWGRAPSGPRLLDPAETPVTFAPAPGALTGPRLLPTATPRADRACPRPVRPERRRASCIARTLLLDDGAEGGGHEEAGAARGHDEDRESAQAPFRRKHGGAPVASLCSTRKTRVGVAWCFQNMAEVKERDVRLNTTGFGKRRIDAADTYHSMTKSMVLGSILAFGRSNVRRLRGE